MTIALYPWESADLFAADQAAAELAADVEFAAWLTEIDEAWLDDILADIEVDDVFADPDCIPFQNVPADWAWGSWDEEPGLLESVAPYLF